MERLIQELSSAVKDEAEERVAARAVLRDCASTMDDPKVAAEISLAFMDLRRLDSVRGAIQVLDGQQEGWRSLERGFLWGLLEQAVLKRLYDRDARRARKPRGNPRDLAIVTLHGLAFRRPEVGWCLEALRSSIDGGAFGKVRELGLATFALWLGKTARGEGNAPADLVSHGVYSAVVAAWRDPAKLEPAVARMAEHHLEHTIDPDDSDLWVDFEMPPFPCFPVEHLALSRVRTDLDLQMPRVQHPLLETRLAELPPGPVGGVTLDVPEADALRSLLAS